MKRNGKSLIQKLLNFLGLAGYNLNNGEFSIYLYNTREEVAGGWRRLHSEELHNFNSLPNIIRVIKLRKMRWA
jgi:hypothetical protein